MAMHHYHISMNEKRTDTFDRSIFTLDQPITYQIEIAGELSGLWIDSNEEFTFCMDIDPSGLATTTLTGTFDQAALIGLLRRLYYWGLPLISVNGTQAGEKKKFLNS